MQIMSNVFYIMVNAYRTSANDGFTNTWEPYICADKKERDLILKNGLPVRDVYIHTSDGHHVQVLSTKGVRMPTEKERRDANRTRVLSVDFLFNKWDRMK
jgi:hypothetical protein